MEERCDETFASNAIPSDGEMQQDYAKVNACKVKAVALSLIDPWPYADQFIDENRTLPIVPDLFETVNLELYRASIESTLKLRSMPKSMKVMP